VWLPHKFGFATTSRCQDHDEQNWGAVEALEPFVVSVLGLCFLFEQGAICLI